MSPDVSILAFVVLCGGGFFAVACWALWWARQ